MKVPYYGVREIVNSGLRLSTTKIFTTIFNSCQKISLRQEDVISNKLDTLPLSLSYKPLPMQTIRSDYSVSGEVETFVIPGNANDRFTTHNTLLSSYRPSSKHIALQNEARSFELGRRQFSTLAGIKKMDKDNNDVSNKLTEFDQGYYKGLAMGILVLFNQDQIKKPLEQIVNYNLLGIEDDSTLELIHELTHRYNQEKFIEVVSDLLSGNEEVRKKVVTDLICKERGYYDNYEYLPECFKNIVSEQEFELQLQGESNNQNDL